MSDKKMTVTLSKEALDLLFTTAKSCIASSGEPPQLEYIKIEVTEKSITAVTLDGYKLAKFTMPHNCVDVQPFDCFIKPFAIPKQLTEAEIAATTTGAVVVMHCCYFDMTYHFTAPSAANFPAYQNIIPKTDKSTEVYLSAKMLAAVLAPFGKMCNRNSIVRLSFVKQADGSINKVAPMLLTAEQDGTQIEAMLLPIRYAGGN